MAFEPIIDGDVLPAAPADLIAAGASADIDILIGSNMDEFRLFLVPDGSIDRVTDGLLRQAITSYGLDPESALRYTETAMQMRRPVICWRQSRPIGSTASPPFA
jgi:carboxylesterase type B